MNPERRRSERTVGEKGEASRPKLGEKRMGMRTRSLKSVTRRGNESPGMETDGRGRSYGAAPPPPTQQGRVRGRARGHREQGADWQKRVALSRGRRGNPVPRRAASSAGSSELRRRDGTTAGGWPTWVYSPCAQSISGAGHHDREAPAVLEVRQS